MNGFVDDMEKIVNELYQMQVTVNDADERVRGDSVKLGKQVHDLEAHINT